MGSIGDMIGQGNTAEVYHYGKDCVLKLYRKDIPEQMCRNEFSYTQLAYRSASGTPEPIEIVYEKDRIGAVYRKINGKSLLKLTLSKPWMGGHYSKCLAEYHHEMHLSNDSVNENLPTVKEKLKRDIANVNRLTENEKSVVIRYLDTLPDGNTLCHFDFHSDNILVYKHQYWIIDWMTACKGDKLSDVARTSVILKYCQIPRVPVAVNYILGKIQKRIYAKYINRYLELSGADIAEVLKWELPVAAARLCERLPEKEEERLLAFILDSSSRLSRI